MSTSPSFVVAITLIALCLPTLRAQLFDFSSGNAASIGDCGFWYSGQWNFESASNIVAPVSGSLSGFVYSSSSTAVSCIKTTVPVTVTAQSKLDMLVYVPYTRTADYLHVFAVTDDETDSAQLLKINGDIPAWGWQHVVVPIPLKLVGKIKIEILARSSSQSISIRYFEITDEDRTTAAPPVFTDPTTVSTAAPPESTTPASVSTTDTVATTPAAAAALDEAFDFSNGSTEGVSFCDGQWRLEEANQFPAPAAGGGSLEGLVLSSSSTSPCSLSTSRPVTITSGTSWFNMQVFVPYTRPGDFVSMFVVSKHDQYNEELLQVSGKTPAWGWRDISLPIPSIFDGEISILIIASSRTHSISIRYFEITG